jgi:hypothetical protein
MRDELLELVMNKATGRASEEELTRIDAILEQEPSLWDDYNQWHRDMPALRGVICFAAATAEDRHQLPEHIRKELRSRMRAALRKPQPNYDRLMELGNKPPNPQPSWRWAVVPAVGLAAIVVISLVLFNNRPEAEAPAPPEVVNNLPEQPAAPAEFVIQVALLDIVGATRGPEDTTLKLFQTEWPSVQIHQFSRSAISRDWLSQWPLSASGPVCKIFYNQSSGELQIIAIVNQKKHEATFELNDVSELPQLIQKSKAQLDEWLK